MSAGNYPPGMSDSDWDHVNGEHLVDEPEEPTSWCCGAEIIMGDICKDCREHI